MLDGKTMVPEPDPIPVTGVRRCWGCHCLYAASAAAPMPAICPVCHSEHTERVSIPAIQRCCVTCHLQYSPPLIWTSDLNKTASDFAKTCPHCKGMDTFPISVESRPTQHTLFTLPAPPRPIAWAVEWRWKQNPKHRWCRPPERYQPEDQTWHRWDNYNVTTVRQAINQVARYRKAHPWQSFRVRPVTWEPTPLLP